MNRRRVLRALPFIAAAVGGCPTTTLEPIASEPAAIDEGELVTSAASCVVARTEPLPAGEERQVRDLSVAEAQAWCESYVSEKHPHADAEPDPVRFDQEMGLFENKLPDYVGGYGARCCESFGFRCFTHPSVADCVANLLHAPCEATLSAFDACIDSLALLKITGDPAVPDACVPVGSACADFGAAPHCEETVAMTMALQPPSDPGWVVVWHRVGPDCGD